MEIDTNISLKSLLEKLSCLMPGIAVAINQKVIKRTVWEEIILRENDSVVIIKATCGG